MSAVVLPEFDGGWVQCGHEFSPVVSEMMGSFLRVGVTRALTMFCVCVCSMRKSWRVVPFGKSVLMEIAGTADPRCDVRFVSVRMHGRL